MAGSFNKVILLGNLTRDPQVRYTSGGTAVTDLGLAVNRSWYDKNTRERKEEVTFVDVTLWGRQAEIAGEYLSKGRSILIEGYLQLDQWDDRESGQKRSKLKVVCENMTMVGGRNDGSGGGRSSSPQRSSHESNSPSGGSEGAARHEDSNDSAVNNFYDDAPSKGELPEDEVPF